MALFPPGKEATMIKAFYDPDCGRFLSMCPKSEFFTFSNQQMEMVLRFRLAMPQLGLIDGTICKCSPNVRGRPAPVPRVIRVDATALHAVTGCHCGGYGGGRTVTHNNVRDIVACAFRYSGYRPRIEARRRTENHTMRR